MTPPTDPLAARIAALGRDVRYVAVYAGGGEPVLWARDDLADASGAESDRYEELLVNPTLLTLARQRGNIDCGGFDYVVVRYGRFFQVIVPRGPGHVSVALEPQADLTARAARIRDLVAAA